MWPLGMDLDTPAWAAVKPFATWWISLDSMVVVSVFMLMLYSL